MEELLKHLDNQGVVYGDVDGCFFNIPDFGECMFADVDSKQSVFRQVKFGDDVSVHLNIFETKGELLADNIRYVFFYFGNEWNYIDLEKEDIEFIPAFNVGKHKEVKFHQNYVNLGAHTGMEVLNGSGLADRWVERARFLGHSHIGVCNENTMSGTLELQKECAKYDDISPVFGYSTFLDIPHIDGGVPIKLYVHGDVGLHNLLRIQKVIAIDREDGMISVDELIEYSEDITLVVGKQQANWLNTGGKALDVIKSSFKDIYFQIDFNEYMANRIDIGVLESLKYYFREVYGTKTHVEPILINDCFYVNKQEFKNKETLNIIRAGTAYNQSQDQWYKTIDETYDTMDPLFKDKDELNELLELSAKNTIELANRCTARYKTDVNYMPEYEMLPEEKEKYGDTVNMFDQMLDEGLNRRIPEEKREEYRKQLEHEKYVIKSTNNVDYMLTQYDMVKWSKQNDILVGTGRGSAGGSLILYLLGITEVDPLKHGLLFERFLVPERAGLYEVPSVTKIDEFVDDSESVAEVEFADGRKIVLDIDSQVAVDGSDRAVYADELKEGDSVVFDNIHNLIDVK